MARASMTGGVSAGRQQFLDLADDGQLDLIALNGPVSGFYERTLEQGWGNFRFFAKMPNIPWDDPNVRFVDLTGDGHADVLITEHEVLTWYPSLAEEGFGPGERVQQAHWMKKKAPGSSLPMGPNPFSWQTSPAMD
jgi:hypothetical protein